MIGVIKSISPSTIVHQRETSKPLSIVRLLLFDSTGRIEVNLWNEMVGTSITVSLLIFCLLRSFLLLVYSCV